MLNVSELWSQFHWCSRHRQSQILIRILRRRWNMPYEKGTGSISNISIVCRIYEYVCESHDVCETNISVTLADGVFFFFCLSFSIFQITHNRKSFYVNASMSSHMKLKTQPTRSLVDIWLRAVDYALSTFHAMNLSSSFSLESIFAFSRREIQLMKYDRDRHNNNKR